LHGRKLGRVHGACLTAVAFRDIVSGLVPFREFCKKIEKENKKACSQQEQVVYIHLHIEHVTTRIYTTVYLNTLCKYSIV